MNQFLLDQFIDIARKLRTDPEAFGGGQPADRGPLPWTGGMELIARQLEARRGNE